MHKLLKYRQSGFGIMDVILLHNGHQDVSAPYVPSSGWRQQEYNYNYNVSKSLHSLQIK